MSGLRSIRSEAPSWRIRAVCALAFVALSGGLAGCTRSAPETAGAASAATAAERAMVARSPRAGLSRPPRAPQPGATSAAAATASSPTFTYRLPHLIYPIGDWLDGTAGLPYAVAIGDVTRDRRKDVVLVTLGGYSASPLPIDHKVLVFRQNAQGGLDAPAMYPYTEGLFENANNGNRAALALADMNEDGAADVVVAYLKGVAVLSSTPDGGFQSRKFLLPAEFRNQTPGFDNYLISHMVALDLDRDSHRDLVVFHGQAASAFYGDGRGGFSSIEPVPLPISAVVDAKTGDFDQDGAIDIGLLSGYRETSRISILRNPGPARRWTETGRTVPVLFPLGGLALGDWNADGRIDAAVSVSKNIANDGFFPDAGLLIADQNALGELTTPRYVPTWQVPGSMETVDLNGDRIPDLLVDHPGWDIGYLLNGPQGLQPYRLANNGAIGSSGNGSQVIAAGDITGDGCNDIVRVVTSITLMVYHGQHCGPWRPMRSLPQPADLRSGP